ncbi:MAG: hypothetical protein L0221_10985 [Chloroflexi bacterium]|nr:hypothetical protein [Chloroflexota bacterium]
MAVYEGARPRGFGLRLGDQRASRGPASDGRTAGGQGLALPRSGSARARLGLMPRPHVGPLGATLGSIVLLFLVGFLWLAQSVRVSATSYDIVRLSSSHDRLDALARDVESDLSRLSGQPAIRKLALDAGLGQLDAAIVLPAR